VYIPRDGHGAIGGTQRWTKEDEKLDQNALRFCCPLSKDFPTDMRRYFPIRIHHDSTQVFSLEHIKHLVMWMERQTGQPIKPTEFPFPIKGKGELLVDQKSFT
jgi:hypothetical protein